jgi:hypothetical protein
MYSQYGTFLHQKCYVCVNFVALDEDSLLKKFLTWIWPKGSGSDRIQIRNTGYTEFRRLENCYAIYDLRKADLKVNASEGLMAWCALFSHVSVWKHELLNVIIVITRYMFLWW